MKKILLLPVLALLLAGCGAQPAMETIGDVHTQQVSAQPRQISLELPEDTQVPAMCSEEGDTLYFCDDYTVVAYILPAGSMDDTLRTVSGFEEDSLCLMGSYSPEGECYESAWTAMGEGEMVLGNARIISHGGYHYVVAVLSPESRSAAARTQIRQVLDSFELQPVSTEP